MTRTRYTDNLDFFGSTTPHELVKKWGSPLYVYNEKILRERCRDLLALSDLPGFTVCYSAKANASPALLKIVREEGLIVDAMSPGEVAMHHRAGFDKNGILYVCNNVSSDELALAHASSFLVSVDSLSQLEAFGKIAPGSKVMIRVNPGIGAGHHKKVITAGKETKFGVVPEDFAAAREICKAHNLRLAGLNQHVGSLFMEADPFLDAAGWLLEVALRLKGLKRFEDLEVIDFGGGFGIPYRKYEGERRLDLADLSAKLHKLIGGWARENSYKGRFIVEPGRYIAAECGLLLGTVHATKNNGPTRYAGTDIGFNVLARPMLYDSFHDVEVYKNSMSEPQNRDIEQTITGNICESGDILAKSRILPELREGDLVGLLDAGAYGYAMASPYNQRLRPAEVLITASGNPKLIRRRETVDDLLSFVVD